ncbi:MAG: NAD-binding protein [Congregibacter sp.]
MRKIPLRTMAAVAIFALALAGFQAGVTLTGDEISESRSMLVNAYFALSLFVIGGIDIGTPDNGPKLAILVLWFAYFAAPLLAISTLLEAFLRVFSNDRWKLRRLKDHIVIAGKGELVKAYLRVLRSNDKKRKVVVVSIEGFSYTEAEQLQRSFSAITWQGDLTDDFTCDQLRIDRACRLLLFGEESLRTYETAKVILDRKPELAGKIIMQSERLRFMRAMATSPVAGAVTVFNPYQIAAETLVKTIIQPHLSASPGAKGVVIAGFGRFGQSILESLQALDSHCISTIALIEKDAERRVMVTREQIAISKDFELEVLEGDIAHPGVWERLGVRWSIDMGDTVYVLATSREEDNLRTALWLRHHNADSLIIARLGTSSAFADELALDNNISALSLHQLVEESITTEWLDCR